MESLKRTLMRTTSVWASCTSGLEKLSKDENSTSHEEKPLQDWQDRTAKIKSKSMKIVLSSDKIIWQLRRKSSKIKTRRRSKPTKSNRKRSEEKRNKSMAMKQTTRTKINRRLSWLCFLCGTNKRPKRSLTTKILKSRFQNLLSKKLITTGFWRKRNSTHRFQTIGQNPARSSDLFLNKRQLL